MKVGLVLGAGGVTGAAYLAGALTALEQDLGWDARNADVIVGTSAGALVGGLLRSGVPASDLAAWTVGARLSDDGDAVVGSRERPQFDPVRLREFLRLPRLPHARAVWSALRHPGSFDPLRALMLHVAPGHRSLTPHVEFLGDAWPERPFWCCAVHHHDGRRVTFGRAFVPADGLSAAVAASCAVPGYFAPVTVDGEVYVDGGVASPTNADVLRETQLDLVIAVAPMSTVAHLPRYSIDRAVREHAGTKLRAELGQLDVARTIVLAPGAEVLEHVTADFMTDERAPEIVAAAFLETGEQLRDCGHVDVLARLRATDAA